MFRSQIADEQIKRLNLKKQIPLLIIFAIPPLTNIILSSLVLVCQLLPPPCPFWLQQTMDYGRYIYVMEPILMFCCIKQFRNLLKSSLMRCCCCCYTTIGTTSQSHTSMGNATKFTKANEHELL